MTECDCERAVYIDFLSGKYKKGAKPFDEGVGSLLDLIGF